MERYFNNFQTTVAAGGYVASSGVLNVLSTTGVSLNSGDTTRLSLYTGSPELVVILIVSAVNSGTQFAVTAEGPDTSASAGDLVLNTLTVGGMNQIRNDISLMGTYANLPNPASAFLVSGQRYKQTDGPYEFIYDGTVWKAFFMGYECVLPLSSSFSWINQGSATIDNTLGFAQLATPGSNGSTDLRVRTETQPSTPYTLDAICTVNFLQSAGNVSFGVGFRDSGSTKLITLHIEYSTSTLAAWQVNRWNSPTSFNAAQATGVAGSVPSNGVPLFVRLKNDGTNLTFYVGDGQSWFEFYTEAVGTFITPTDICFWLDLEGTTSGQVNFLSWYTH